VFSSAGPAAAGLPAFDVSTLVQAEASLGSLVNAERTGQGLVALQVDPDVVAIARQRAEAMAAADVLSHQNPDGSDVFDQIVAAGIPWFGAGEVIVWNSWPAATDPLRRRSGRSGSARTARSSCRPPNQRRGRCRFRERNRYYAGVLVAHRPNRRLGGLGRFTSAMTRESRSADW
jgi:hypothetical protein